MNVRYSLEALAHIESIEAYVSTRDPAAARRVVARISAACRQLGDYPKMGHTGLVSGTFEWSVTGLLISSFANKRPRQTRSSSSPFFMARKIAKTFRFYDDAVLTTGDLCRVARLSARPAIR